MSVPEKVLSRLGTVGEIFAFLWGRKLWWLLPMVVLLMIFGGLLIFGQATGIAPFIYTLF